MTVGGSPAKGRIASLDGLRAVSIGMVLVGHLEGTTGYPANAVTAFLGRFSHLGVQVFFVISGFLITTLLLNEQARNGRIDLRAFYERRARRIFPAAYCYIAFATASRFLLHRPFPPKYVAYAATYTVCYVEQMPWVLAHLWSLSVEEQFYLLWPFALAFAFARGRALCWAVMIIVPVCRAWFAAHHPRLVDYAFPAVADAIAAGCLLALYRESLPGRGSRLCHGVTFVAVSVLAVSTPFWQSPRTMPFWGVGPIIIAMAIHIAIERADWILNNRLAALIGVMSYSIYLYQQPFLTQSGTTNRWSSFPLNLVLALIAASGSYFLVERPFLRYRARVTPPPAGPTPAPSLG